MIKNFQVHRNHKKLINKALKNLNIITKNRVFHKVTILKFLKFKIKNRGIKQSNAKLMDNKINI